MTNNIIVEFSSSIYKVGEQTELGYKNGELVSLVAGDFKQYNVVSGSSFSFEYNETLDNAVIVLDHVKIAKRLSFIKPYDFVHVFDASSWDATTGKYLFDNVYLLDNFQEQETSITEGNHIFSYIINLMSETKLLEKIQCPSLSVTHTVNENGTISKKTIYEIIAQYMYLYIPKIKKAVLSGEETEWEYKPLITMPTIGTDFYNRFNVPSADLASSFLTLRQLLTTLMQQVGCIPVVKNLTLDFLDFQKEPITFANYNPITHEYDYYLDNTVNKISRSLSSDSYVNTLVNTSSNVLDSDNEVICETLGFRDRTNVYLKQSSNLFLETKFPIYKVNRCEMKIHSKYYDLKLKRLNNVIAGSWFPSVTLVSMPQGAGTLTFRINYGNERCNMFNLSLKFCHSNPNDSYNWVRDGIRNYGTIEVPKYNSSQAINYLEYTISIPTTSTIVWFDCTCSSLETLHNDVKAFGEKNKVYIAGYGSSSLSSLNDEIAPYNFYTIWNQDITPLVVESKKRSLLETDYSAMSQETNSNNMTVEKLSKYYYGTVGYEMGGKSIVGFSGSYEVGQQSVWGWLNRTYTYIENIVEVLSKTDNLGSIAKEQISSALDNYPIIVKSDTETTVFNDNYGSLDFKRGMFNYGFDEQNHEYYKSSFLNGKNFAGVFFDLYYQPLNSFNLSFVKSKEDIEIPLEQFDSSSSGPVDFDRLSINQQEQVDRIGNETLSISQRTETFSNVKNFDNGPLFFLDDLSRNKSYSDIGEQTKYTIFRYNFTVNNYFYNANYTASKDAILKNYFTSIKTKYRAYQYVDYSQSQTRKEREVVYVRIGKDYYDGDDKIFLGKWSLHGQSEILKNESLKYFVYGLVSGGSEKKIKYVTEKGPAKVGHTYYSVPNISPQASHTFISREVVDEQQIVKNDISSVSSRNSFAVIYENEDNVGAGSYIRENVVLDASENKIYDLPQQIKEGGLIQSHQEWGNLYNTSRTVSYVFNIDFYSGSFLRGTGNSGTDDGTSGSLIYRNFIKRVGREPIINETGVINDQTILTLNPDLMNFSYSLMDYQNNDNVAFTLVDNNKSGVFTKTYYKDLSEKINQTVEFIYYSDSNNISWSSIFIENNGFINKQAKPCNGIVALNANDSFEADANDNNVGTLTNYTDVNDFVSIITVNQPHPYISVHWNAPMLYGINKFKLVHVNKDGTWNDIICFRRPNVGDSDYEYYSQNGYAIYYISLNDTKTDYVLAERNGLLYKRYKVSTNTSDRTVIDLYANQE